MATVIPTQETKVDDKFGNHFSILKVTHVNGTASAIDVDLSAVSAAELPSSGTGILKEASPSAGVSIADATSTDGKKEVTIASGVASGTYFIVVRYIGSAGGVGSGLSGN